MHANPTSLGFGLGLRSQYHQEILDHQPAVDWFEVVSENYLVTGGKPLYYLDAIAERYPLVMHGVSLSIGGPHRLDRDYLRQLKDLAQRVQPRWVSDHLCWSRGNAHQLHDLLPLPFTEESLSHVAGRVAQVQELLGRPLVLENVSSYLRCADSEMSEWEFLAALVERSGCELLLDVNNVYVSARNQGFEPWDFISALPAKAIRQLHLAGHSDYGHYLIDTHDAPICDPVWQLYQRTLAHLGPVATLLERDDHLPPLDDLLAELGKARALAAATLAQEAACA
ncbi:DUF692 domain-containing protein [Metapseudomonas resinovorans]|uniref:UPF0276 protein PCA10_11730 n=1 Tax=Metapseudomonas resinovorans NBRC 106553 TaxID=1245471 RepID=S6AG45_METRE|nr:DUF692 domain-containing protein [Pseudomonas resinovorans]BAN46905.1 hypothetical protein PCA10_11730 [Pseudomonas resinovorans NBRC 106553]